MPAVTFFIVLLVYILGSVGSNGWPVLLAFMLMGPVLLLTILVHELGHCFAARSIGGTVNTIVLWPLGGLSSVSYYTTYKKATWVALAGPLTHIPQVGLWLLLLLPSYHASTGSWHIALRPPSFVGERHFGHALCVYAIYLNFALLALNLLVPAYPLKGANLFALQLRAAGASMRSTATAATAISAPLGLALFALGCLESSVLMTLVALAILFSTAQLLAAIRDDELAEHPLFAPVRNDTGAGPPAATAAAAGGGNSVEPPGEFRGGGVGSSGGAFAGGPPSFNGRAYPSPPSQYGGNAV
ncbi:hypothetical protein PLESTB_001031600 [Pleodorina starrii]|uniref:Peptidase M50 domain-containing protein n=1 Tax=Pleodorina starrii TaxID=330485 RepID=A0A9W6F449_9CHLO|nr:hypothetical protein PLESTB_001031600 [Pleodorina starrii]